MVGTDALDLPTLYDRVVETVMAASEPEVELIVDEVYLFGSVARGDATPPESDVDLLVVVSRDNGPNLDPVVDRQLRRIADNIEFRAESILGGTPFRDIDAVLTIPRNEDQRVAEKATDRGGGNVSPVLRLPEGEPR